MSSTMWPPEDEEALWSWSCERYARPGVAEACLRLQDEQGVQVNLLLLGLWLAGQGRAVAAEQAGQIAGAATAWQEAVVGPLREVRRRLKPLAGGHARQADLEALRRAVAADELAAERIEQIELQRLAGSCPPDGREAGALAAANLAMLMPVARNRPVLPPVLLDVLDPSGICRSRDFRVG